MITHRNWVAMVANLMAELPLIDDTDVLLHVRTHEPPERLNRHCLLREGRAHGDATAV